MAGPELVLLLLAVSAGLRLVAERLTVPYGRDLCGNKERALKAGAKAVVQKPWDDDELLGLIARLLGEPDLYSESGSIPIWDADEKVT